MDCVSWNDLRLRADCVGFGCFVIYSFFFKISGPIHLICSTWTSGHCTGIFSMLNRLKFRVIAYTFELLIGKSTSPLLFMTRSLRNLPRVVMSDFWHPFFPDVFEGMRRDDAEADEEDVRLRVGQRAQPIVVLLSRSVEQTWQVERWVSGLLYFCGHGQKQCSGIFSLKTMESSLWSSHNSNLQIGHLLIFRHCSWNRWKMSWTWYNSRNCCEILLIEKCFVVQYRLKPSIKEFTLSKLA